MMADASRRPGFVRLRTVAFFAVATASLLAGCSALKPQAPTATASNDALRERGTFSPSRYGAASPRVVAEGRAVPSGGGRDMVGQPYVVAGRRYVPTDDPNYTATGLASWYGANFHGRRTANGEVYDMHALSAAHPTMPLPSYARVTNLQNGRSLVVRVNDRGPFHANRVIDVSAEAADMLDMQDDGVARVQVDFVGRAPVAGGDERMLMASFTQGRPGVVSTPQSDVRMAAAAGAAIGQSVQAVSDNIQLAFQATRVTTQRPAPAARQAPSTVAASAPRPVPARAPAPVATAVQRAEAPPPVTAYNPFAGGQADAMFVSPAALTGPDPLAAILADAPSARLYAPLAAMTPAQQAAEAFAAASPGTGLRGAIAAATPPANARPEAVQIGVFADRANVERLSSGLAAFGDVVVRETQSGDRTLWSVKVLAASADAAIAAATRLGAPGAVRVAN